MHTLTTIILTAAASGALWFPLTWALKARMDARPRRWPQRVCGRLYDGGGIAGAGVTVEESLRLQAGGNGR